MGHIRKINHNFGKAFFLIHVGYHDLQSLLLKTCVIHFIKRINLLYFKVYELGSHMVSSGLVPGSLPLIR